MGRSFFMRNLRLPQLSAVARSCIPAPGRCSCGHLRTGAQAVGSQSRQVAWVANRPNQSPRPACPAALMADRERFPRGSASSELTNQIPYRRLVRLKGLAALRLCSLQRGIRPAHEWQLALLAKARSRQAQTGWLNMISRLS
jgi:hypothetical protein